MGLTFQTLFYKASSETRLLSTEETEFEALHTQICRNYCLFFMDLPDNIQPRRESAKRRLGLHAGRGSGRATGAHVLGRAREPLALGDRAGRGHRERGSRRHSDPRGRPAAVHRAESS